jgi:hypothetical protein
MKCQCCGKDNPSGATVCVRCCAAFECDSKQSPKPKNGKEAAGQASDKPKSRKEKN